MSGRIVSTRPPAGTQNAAVCDTISNEKYKI